MSSYEAPIELLPPAKEPREECFFFPPLQTNQLRLDESLSQVEKAIQHSKDNYEKLKLEFEDLKKTCTILVANLHTSEKKLETATVENLALKSDARLNELKRENKQLQDERTRHQIWQRDCLNEVQSMRKDRSDLYTQLQQVKKTNKLHVDALQLTEKGTGTSSQTETSIPRRGCFIAACSEYCESLYSNDSRKCNWGTR